MNKRQVVETAYQSFLKTFDCETKFIVDKPERWLLDLIKDRGEVMEVETQDWQSGNELTFNLQLNLAKHLPQNVLLLEDDYLWVDDKAQGKLEAAIKDFGIVSPYDHPNHYFEPGYCGPRIIRHTQNHHWQKIVSSTLTFGVKPEIVDKYWADFTSHGTVDDQMWKSLNHDLWSPIPTLAIHVETDFVSPTFSWENLL